MPGIAGLISRGPADHCQRLTREMLACMQRDGPFTSTTYWAPDLGVYAGSVSRKGSFADRQPILSRRSDIALLFSGECFGSPEPGVDLVQDYEIVGEAWFAKLNGLFSGLIVDRRQHRAILFNDRYGMERLYYHEARDGLFFASEAKALLRVLPEIRAFDEDALADFVHYGCTLDGRTLFRGVRLVPGASQWSFERDKHSRRSYFSPVAWESQPLLSADAFERQFCETFSRILPRYFRADSEVGISLTGGLDTRMIMACRPAESGSLVSYTFAGAERDTLDARLAARVAAQCGVPHHVLRIGQEFFRQFPSLADQTVHETDGCYGICGAHEIYLNRLARDLAPIRLTGNFGSEVFRAVTTFKSIGVSRELFDPDVETRLSSRTAAVTKNTHPVSFAVFKEIPWHLIGVVLAANSQLTTRTPYLDNELVALAFQAPDTVRRSSRPAIHVIRNGAARLDSIPTDGGLLPASRLYSYVAPLWYRTSFKLDYWRKEGLPNWLRRFDGSLSSLDGIFGSHRYLSYRRWFQRELADYLRERLTDPQTLQMYLWNRGFLDRIVESHVKGRGNYLREIDIVLTCATIQRLLLRDVAASEPAVTLS